MGKVVEILVISDILKSCPMGDNYYRRTICSSQFSSVSDFPNGFMVGNGHVWFLIVPSSYCTV